MSAVTMMILIIVGMTLLSMGAGWVIRGMWEQDKRLENDRLIPGRVGQPINKNTNK